VTVGSRQLRPSTETRLEEPGADAVGAGRGSVERRPQPALRPAPVTGAGAAPTQRPED